MDNVYVEKDCVFEHEGHKFKSGGAFVSPDYLIAYPGDNGVLKDWHGNAIGTWKTISTRKAVFFGYNSCWSDKYFYMRAVVNGKEYSLRGFGKGMVAKGKALKPKTGR